MNAVVKRLVNKIGIFDIFIAYTRKNVKRHNAGFHCEQKGIEYQERMWNDANGAPPPYDSVYPRTTVYGGARVCLCCPLRQSETIRDRKQRNPVCTYFPYFLIFVSDNSGKPVGNSRFRERKEPIPTTGAPPLQVKSQQDGHLRVVIRFVSATNAINRR
ncbi:Hypothetical protein CINCED_3A022718 [Cinara cedri]|uniref:Uncharacterized protein n=1 Tax=Cinara cedri TaxID=506608 RepID=A0A5E4NHX9_9HEMI|nr:Hypothetical protein CINCED_3A022718 [Cinara cedri]